jgi:hypothetical protein
MDIIGYDENDVSYFILFESEKKWQENNIKKWSINLQMKSV